MINLFKKKKVQEPEKVMHTFDGYILDKDPDMVYLFIPSVFTNVRYKTMKKCKCECEYSIYESAKYHYYRDMIYNDGIDASKCTILEVLQEFDLFEYTHHPFITREEFMSIDSEDDYNAKAKEYAVNELEALGFDKKFGESFVKYCNNMIDLREDIDFLQGLMSSGLTKCESIQTLYIKRGSNRR